MCLACLSRRSLLAAAALMPAAPALAGPPRARPPATVEPHMRLAGLRGEGLVVALTLDACMGGFDRRIASALVEHGIPATIFATAIWLRRNAEGLAFLLARRDLFAIENHGEAHVPAVLGAGRVFGIPAAGDLDAVRREVTLGAAAVAAASGVRPAWFRGATARYSPAALAEIRGLGFGVAGYSVNADQGASLPGARVAARIAAAGAGDVILAHVNHPERPSGAGVAAGVVALQRRGARFVRLDAVAYV